MHRGGRNCIVAAVAGLLMTGSKPHNASTATGQLYTARKDGNVQEINWSTITRLKKKVCVCVCVCVVCVFVVYLCGVDSSAVIRSY